MKKVMKSLLITLIYALAAFYFSLPAINLKSKKFLYVCDFGYCGLPDCFLFVRCPTVTHFRNSISGYSF